MRVLHLSDLDPQRVADELTRAVHARTQRDARHLGITLTWVAGIAEGKQIPAGTLLAQSKLHSVVFACVDWAKSGKGKPEAVAGMLRELRAALDGVEPGEVSGRAWDLTTVTGVMLVAAEARLAVVEGRTVEATEIATLASVDERSIRATVKAGTLEPVGPGRPMRFAADVAREYLYKRGVPGFAAPPPRVVAPT